MAAQRLNSTQTGTYTTIVTTNGTTTFTVATPDIVFFTGTLKQSVVLPATSTLMVGWRRRIDNKSTDAVLVSCPDTTKLLSIPAGGSTIITCILASGSSSASWKSSGVSLAYASSADLGGAATSDSVYASQKSVKTYVDLNHGLRPATDDVTHASAATLDLTADDEGTFAVGVTGTTPISAITLAEGDTRLLHFTSAGLVLTASTDLVTKGGGDTTTEADDWALIRGTATGIEILKYFNDVRFSKETFKSIYMQEDGAITFENVDTGQFYVGKSTDPIALPLGCYWRFVNGGLPLLQSNDDTGGVAFNTSSLVGTKIVSYPNYSGTLVLATAPQSLINKKLGSLTTNGFVTTSGSDGTLSVDTTTYATAADLAAIIASSDAMVFKGVIDCSANPNYPAADRGHTYRVSVAGKIGGASGVNVEAGDLLLCLTDSTSSGNQATVGSAWTISQTNLDGAVIGPASTTDSSIALYDGTTGKLLKAGLVPGTGVATFLATPSSANLAAAVTGETGSGALMFGTGPTMSDPVINGLPSGAGVDTAATGNTLVLRDADGNINGGYIYGAIVAGATVISTGLVTAASASDVTLTAASEQENFVTGTTVSQNFILPNSNTVGVALGQGYFFRSLHTSTGTILVKAAGGGTLLTLAPGTAAWVYCKDVGSGNATSTNAWTAIYFGSVISTGKKFAATASLTLAGTDSTTHTFPATSSSVARIDAAQSFAGDQTFGAKIISGAAIRLKGYTVAGLPAGTQGDTAFCTDLLAPGFLVAAVGGGAVVGPVFYNGTAWVAY